MIGTGTCAGFIVVERSIPALSRRTQAAPLKSVRQRGLRGSGGRIRGDGGGWCSRLRLLRFGRHRCNQCDGVESNQGAHGTPPFVRRALRSYAQSACLRHACARDAHIPWRGASIKMSPLEPSPVSRGVGCWRQGRHFGTKPPEMPLDSACRRASLLRSYEQEQTRPPTYTRSFPRCGAASMDIRELYSIEEARFMLGGISRATIYELLNNGELPGVAE